MTGQARWFAAPQDFTIATAANEFKAAGRRAPTPPELDSRGSLCTLARSSDPVAVLEIPLIAA
jgi:hypothetical protein